MKAKRVLKAVILGIALFLAGLSVFIAFHPLSDAATDSLWDSFRNPGERLGNMFRHLKSFSLYGKPYERSTSASRVCVENLTKIDHAKQEWAMDNKKSGSDIPIVEELIQIVKEWPECPSRGAYTINALDCAPKCSIGGKYHSLYWKEPISTVSVFVTGTIIFLIALSLFLRFSRHGAAMRDRLTIRISR